MNEHHWMTSHECLFCSLLHKKCHLKRYHSDIKYHMILNIIFSVVLIGKLFWAQLVKSEGVYKLKCTFVYMSRSKHGLLDA